ncbi:MAG TPA: hypothetical protein PLQ41_05045 [bacterium]|nr:hypothetical protein [bacterium]HPP30173.1 hypothetical protein [bacterium]
MKTVKRVLKAGIAKSDITTTAESAKIHDPLYAKALVLEDGETYLVIISMDTTAIGGRRISANMLYDVGEEFLPSLREKIQTELDIPGSNVLVNASHTHPPGRLLCSDDEQVKRVFDAVKRAFHSRVEVMVGSGTGYEDRISINRTLRLKNGRHWTIRHAYPSPPDEEVKELGPVDNGIGIVRIDRIDGKPLAIIYNFACHPLSGVPGGYISAYFPGFASKVIEETLGDGAMAIFLQGAGGDVCDILYKDVHHPRNTEQFGTMLGLSTLKALREIKTEKGIDLKVLSETIKLPTRRDFPEVIEKLEREQAELLKSLRFTSLNIKTFLELYIKYNLHPEYPSDYSYRYLHSENRGSDEFLFLDEENRRNIEKYLKNIYTMEKLVKLQDDIETLKKHQEIVRETGEYVMCEVQGIKIGDCVIITSPAELLTEVGLNIKRASPYRKTFVAAYSNGYLHYGPPASHYDKGGYEVTECLLAPEWEGIYERKALEIIMSL